MKDRNRFRLIYAASFSLIRSFYQLFAKELLFAIITKLNKLVGGLITTDGPIEVIKVLIKNNLREFSEFCYFFNFIIVTFYLFSRA